MKEEQVKLVVLQVFENPFQAHLSKSILADYGIDSYVQDENFVTLNPLYTNLVGGIRLMIKSTDFEEAKELLFKTDSLPFTKEDDTVITCPKCSSKNILSGFKSIKSIKSFFAILLALLTGTYPIFSDSTYYCKDCKTRFKI